MLEKKRKALNIPVKVQAEFNASLDKYEDDLTKGLIAASKATKRLNYRKLAFDHYEQLGQILCAHCGFGIRDVLEVAHLDGDQSNNDVYNLVILCPNCHKMHDLDLISTEIIVEMRDRPKVVLWAKRMKDAGVKAAKTRQDRIKWKNAGKKAAETRKLNAAKKKSQSV